MSIKAAGGEKMTQAEGKLVMSEKLFDVYLALRETPENKELQRQARRAESAMSAEDIAYIKDQVKATP